MTSFERRIGCVEDVARERLIRAGMIQIGARLAAGDEVMGAALDRLAATSTREAGLIELEKVLALLDERPGDSALHDHLQQLVEEIGRMSDTELLAFLARGGRR